MATSDYGRYIARKRAQTKARKAAEVQVSEESKPKRAPRKKSAPKVDWFPFNNIEQLPRFDHTIDWSSQSTVDISKELAKRLDTGDSNMQLLQMPTGTGKTAAAIAALGEYQKVTGKKVPFIVIASRKIHEKKSWHKTLVSWNDAHPDNTLEPVLIDTFDRFANIIQNGTTFKQLITHATKDCVLVLDEVHNYKSPTSKRSKQLQKLSFMKRIGLTATPWTNDIVMDQASYLILAGFYANKSRFMRDTALESRLGFNHDFLIYDNDGRISTQLWPQYVDVLRQLSHVVYKPDVSMQDVDMPEVTNHYITIHADDTMRNDIVSLGKAYTSRMFDSITEFLLEVTYRTYCDKQRLDKLVEIIKTDGVKQPLIFYWHVQVKDEIVKTLNENGIPYYEISGQSSLPPEAANDTTTPILIQYQAGSEGIELLNSNTSIFYQNQYSCAKLDQARGRNVRRSSVHRDVDHYYLICDQHFDTELFERVKNKEEIAQDVVEQIALFAADQK